MPATTQKTRDWPLYWFATLEQAVNEGDHETAANAQRELARLGVRVHYGRPQDVPRADRHRRQVACDGEPTTPRSLVAN